MSRFIFVVFLFLPLTANAVLNIGLGSNLTYFNYVESLQPPQKSTETATFGTISAETTWYFAETAWLRTRGDYIANVASTYDGSDLITNKSARAINTLGFANFEITATFKVMPDLDAYIGYGWRKWDRFLSGSPGYREIYSWNYMPIGLVAWFYHGDSIDLGADFSVRPVYKPKLRVVTSETTTNGEDSDLELGVKTGYRIALPAVIQLPGLGVEYEIHATAWFEHSEFGESPFVRNANLGRIMEPASKTDQAGLDLIFVYEF